MSFLDAFAVVFSHKPIVFRATRPCKARHTQREKQRAKAKCHERMEKGQDTARTGFLAVICMYSCVRTCVYTYGMVPRYVIECFIHKRRTKPACLSWGHLASRAVYATQQRFPEPRAALKTSAKNCSCIETTMMHKYALIIDFEHFYAMIHKENRQMIKLSKRNTLSRYTFGNSAQKKKNNWRNVMQM